MHDVSSKESYDYESYYLDLDNNVVGNIGGYVPRDFFGFGIVSNWIYDGYSKAEELEAKWSEDANDIVIDVGGPSEVAEKMENACDKLFIFQRKITLTKH